jgi:hypothetical protein
MMSSTAEEVTQTKTARGSRQAAAEVSASDPAAPLETPAPAPGDSGVQKPIHYGPGKGYIERDDFIPNPTDMAGEFMTAAEGGFLGSVTSPTPIFERAREIDLRTALRAVDPNDTEVPEHLVVLPDSGRTIDGAKQALVDAAAAAGVDVSQHDVKLSDGTPITASNPTPPANPPFAFPSTPATTEPPPAAP